MVYTYYFHIPHSFTGRQAGNTQHLCVVHRHRQDEVQKSVQCSLTCLESFFLHARFQQLDQSFSVFDKLSTIEGFTEFFSLLFYFSSPLFAQCDRARCDKDFFFLHFIFILEIFLSSRFNLCSTDYCVISEEIFSDFRRRRKGEEANRAFNTDVRKFV